MSLEITRTRTAPPGEWDGIWAACDYAAYSHSRGWAELWEDYSEGAVRPDPRLIEFSDGKRAVVPLLRTGARFGGLAKSFESSVKGAYGGWISRDGLGVEHARRLIDYMTTKCGDLYWRVNPYDETAFAAGIARNDEVTRAIDLTPGFDAVYGGFIDANKRAVRKARTAGVTVRAADSEKDWRDYFEVYEDSMARWGDTISSKYRYSWRLFEEIFRRRPMDCRLWLAAVEGRTVAGALCFYARRLVTYWHGSARKDYFAHRPVNLLMHDIIRDACERGYAWYDFNPSGRLSGVQAFKESFGGQNLSCPEIETESLVTRGVNKLASLFGTK